MGTLIRYNGRNSDEFKLFVEHYPARPVPKRKFEKWSVPGRSGDLIAVQDAFENVTRRYEVYLSAEGPGLAPVAAAALQWLLEPGWHELEDEYDVDTFCIATYTGEADIANIQNSFGRFTLAFDCWPQRFLKSGARPVSMAQAGSLFNPTAYTAKPLIVVQGSGSGTLTVNGTTLALANVENLTLDCQDEEAWSGSANRNSTVTGSYPTLGAGENAISWTGGISAVEITPRWWTL